MKKEHVRAVAALLALAGWLGLLYWHLYHDGTSLFDGLLYLVIWAVVGIGFFYIDHRRRTAASTWPTVLGTVQFCTDSSDGDKEGAYQLTYSYPVNGEYYSARINVLKERWTDDPCWSLRGASIQVRINPRNPEESVVEAASIPGTSSTGRYDLIPCDL